MPALKSVMGGAITPKTAFFNKNYTVIPPLFNTVFKVLLKPQTLKNETPN